MIQASFGGLDVGVTAAIGSIIASLATLLLVAFNGGKITQRVADHDEKFIAQGNTNIYVNEKISEHDRSISELKGIDLATRRSTN